MTVLFFVRLFYPHIGGVEKHVWEVSKRLLRKGYTVTVVSEQYDGELSKHEAVDNIDVYRIPIATQGWFKKFVVWYWLWNHRDLLEKADIVHCHDVFFWYLPFRFLYPFKKVFTTFHGYESYPVRKKTIVVRKISEVLSEGSICIGEFMRKWYSANPTYISYGGVTVFRGKKSAKKHTAVFIGRLDEHTNIAMYIQAYKRLKKKIPLFSMIVLGDGEEKKIIPDDVVLLTNETNVEKYLVSSRFAFVSRYLAILEALAAKRLAFAVYYSPIKKDYLLMSPFAEYIVVCKSVHELTSKVLYFLNHPQKEQQLVQKGYTWVQTQSWRSVVDMYCSLWRKYLPKHSEE